jgi:hypothetical protein
MACITLPATKLALHGKAALLTSTCPVKRLRSTPGRMLEAWMSNSTCSSTSQHAHNNNNNQSL